MSHPPDGALRLPNPDARTSVIQRLQATASKHNPGSEKFERADLAIDLALSPDRCSELAPFLMRNLKRDARRILNFQPHHEVLFSTIENTALATTADSDEPMTLEKVLPQSRHPSPDEEVIANELEEKVRRAVKPLPNGEACLDAMLGQGFASNMV
jgi:hypothetical protein